jgi:hypothetical protein
MAQPARLQIERHAKEEFAVAQERIAVKNAENHRRALAQVSLTGNVGGYLPALTEVAAEHVRKQIIALANAYVKAFDLFEVPCDIAAERSLEAVAQQIAGTSISTLGYQLDLMSRRTRRPPIDFGGYIHREIDKAMRSALKEGVLRLKRQRIKCQNSFPPVLRAGSETGGLARKSKPKAGAPSEQMAGPANDARVLKANAMKWDSIEISFLGDFRVQIRSGKSLESFNYAELGFADGRAKGDKTVPKRAWIILRIMAERKGTIRNATGLGVPWPKVERGMQEIRKAFRGHFGISADPVPFIEGTGYRAAFKISCGPSYRV